MDQGHASFSAWPHTSIDSWDCLLRDSFIESFARVRVLSITGKLLRAVVDRFVVQWPKLLQNGGRVDLIFEGQQLEGSHCVQYICIEDFVVLMFRIVVTRECQTIDHKKAREMTIVHPLHHTRGMHESRMHPELIYASTYLLHCYLHVSG